MPKGTYIEGYEAYKRPHWHIAVKHHFSGKEPLDMSDDWFNGFQDATDDAQQETPL